MEKDDSKAEIGITFYWRDVVPTLIRLFEIIQEAPIDLDVVNANLPKYKTFEEYCSKVRKQGVCLKALRDFPYSSEEYLVGSPNDPKPALLIEKIKQGSVIEQLAPIVTNTPEFSVYIYVFICFCVCMCALCVICFFACGMCACGMPAKSSKYWHVKRRASYFHTLT